ncbi:hypothetical protein [Lactobacillus crispatus]|uniref:hypothetical protein n=1 Tax=Lactobacillus crispatus TaxID=47770 RepID=UPI00105C1A24|nr:hypothetical protein [Lactobacillus crispatus]TDN00450.1 hypothetical protein CEE85_14050 [Lactobacillus crispatus]
MTVKGRKKLKNIIHRFKLEKQSKEKNDHSEQETETFKNPDDNLNFYSARYQEVKQDNLTHELNRIRRMAIKDSLNKFEHPDSNHELLEPYQKSGEWLDWIGIVSDISMPTGKTGKMDGKILIDKFSYENANEQKDLLDYHIWLPVNEIRYLLNTDKQTIAIGDLIRGKSKVIQYTGRGKGHGVKYGLGATLIKAAGIYVSFQKVNFQHVAIGRQLQSNYDRQNDWVLKLTNDVSKEITDKYTADKNIDIFIPKTHGHVLAKYQPSQYDHYFNRLETIPVEDKKLDDKPQSYTATIKNFDVKNFDNKSLPIIHLVKIRNKINRIVNSGSWYQFDSKLASLGELRENDKISFVASPAFFAQHTEKQVLNSPQLITNSNLEDREELPNDATLLCGWILNNKSIKNPSYKTQDIINKYLYWKRNIKSGKEEIPVGISIDALADKTQIPVEKIQAFISKKEIAPLFSINGTDYFIDDFIDELKAYIKSGNERVKTALEKAMHTKQELSIHRPKEVIKDSTPISTSRDENNKSKSSKKVAPKVIKKAFVIEIDTKQGIYTTVQFNSLKQAYSYINRLCQQSLNAFLQVSDDEGNELFISVKDIELFRIKK